jgi:hypothetical protein
MSWATCYAGSNNIHFNFPPIMADGRNYATWQPGAVVNERIRENNNITSNWDYRNFLQHNATKIIQANSISACNNCGSCPPLYVGSQNPDVQSNTPFVFASPLDSSQPFGYETSDLKNLYLSRYDLQSRMLSPSIPLSQAEMLAQGIPRSN